MLDQLTPDVTTYGVGGAGTIVGAALVYVARAIVTLAKRITQFVDQVERHQANESAHWQREEAFFSQFRHKPSGPQGVVRSTVREDTTPIEVVVRDAPSAFGFRDGEG